MTNRMSDEEIASWANIRSCGDPGAEQCLLVVEALQAERIYSKRLEKELRLEQLKHLRLQFDHEGYPSKALWTKWDTECLQLKKELADEV